MNKIELCKKCKNRKFDFKRGILCGLTDEKPTFEINCPHFEKDETVKEYKGLDLKPNDQQAKVLLISLKIILVINFIFLIFNTLQYIYSSVGNEISTNMIIVENIIKPKIIQIYLITYIVSIITFLMWFKRAYFNLHQKVKNLSYSVGWAVGSWFVPILNFFRPYQIMKELYQETKKLLLNKGLITEDSLSTKYIGLWWTLWIIGGIIARLAFKFTINNILLITDNIIGIFLALITIKVIKDYSKVEPLLKK